MLLAMIFFITPSICLGYITRCYYDGAAMPMPPYAAMPALPIAAMMPLADDASRR